MRPISGSASLGVAPGKFDMARDFGALEYWPRQMLPRKAVVSAPRGPFLGYERGLEPSFFSASPLRFAPKKQLMLMSLERFGPRPQRICWGKPQVGSDQLSPRRSSSWMAMGGNRRGPSLVGQENSNGTEFALARDYFARCRPERCIDRTPHQDPPRMLRWTQAALTHWPQSAPEPGSKAA